MSDLADELGTDEHDALEFKRDDSNRDKLRKSICALANDFPGRGGGTLLIGVDDDGTPFGWEVTDERLLIVANMREDGRIVPPPIMTVAKDQFAGVDVIRVNVSPSSSPPVRFDGTVQVRVGPSSRPAFPAEERILVERAQAVAATFDQRPVPGTSSRDLDLEFFASTYLPAAVSAEVLEENQRDQAHQLASLRMANTDSVPTAAGLVVLGYAPTAWLPGAYVQFVRYAGVDPASEPVDQDELHGNLRQILTRLEERLRGLITNAVVDSEGFEQSDVPSYPFAALREVIVNALVHRSYEMGGPVLVRWFSDRVEVTNPGGPYGVVTDANFDRITDYRNPLLAEAAKNLGYMNRFGRGVALVRGRLAENGNPPPEYGIEPTFWSVIIKARP